MVKKARVLDVEVDQEADVPYEATRLAQRAPQARRRLLGLLMLGALVAAINAVALRSVLWGAGVLVALACAWGVRKERLGGVVATALLALVGVLLPLRLVFVAERDLGTLATLVVTLVLAAACLPDIILLFRDAELQNAYGRWARR